MSEPNITAEFVGASGLTMGDDSRSVYHPPTGSIVFMTMTGAWVADVWVNTVEGVVLTDGAFSAPDSVDMSYAEQWDILYNPVSGNLLLVWIDYWVSPMLLKVIEVTVSTGGLTYSASAQGDLARSLESNQGTPEFAITNDGKIVTVYVAAYPYEGRAFVADYSGGSTLTVGTNIIFAEGENYPDQGPNGGIDREDMMLAYDSISDQVLLWFGTGWDNNNRFLVGQLSGNEISFGAQTVQLPVENRSTDKKVGSFYEGKFLAIVSQFYKTIGTLGDKTISFTTPVELSSVYPSYDTLNEEPVLAYHADVGYFSMFNDGFVEYFHPTEPDEYFLRFESSVGFESSSFDGERAYALMDNGTVYWADISQGVFWMATHGVTELS